MKQSCPVISKQQTLRQSLEHTAVCWGELWAQHEQKERKGHKVGHRGLSYNISQSTASVTEPNPSGLSYDRPKWVDLFTSSHLRHETGASLGRVDLSMRFPCSWSNSHTLPQLGIWQHKRCPPQGAEAGGFSRDVLRWISGDRVCNNTNHVQQERSSSNPRKTLNGGLFHNTPNKLSMRLWEAALCIFPTTNTKKDWGDGSTGKELAAQISGLEFELLEPTVWHTSVISALLQERRQRQ